MLSPSELSAYADVMRDKGIITFKQEGVEITLLPRMQLVPADGDGQRSRPYTDEELQFAATEGLPE